MPTVADRSPLVVDASAVVALVTGSDPVGGAIATVCRQHTLYAPELMPFEVGAVLRRHLLGGRLDETAATLAHVDLLELAVALVPYRPLAEQTWELRDNVSVYDASYLALARLLRCQLVTLDRRLERAARRLGIAQVVTLQ